MIEIPEAQVVAKQVNDTVVGKKVAHVTVGHTPHKFAWFCGDPQNYPALLSGKTVAGSGGYGSMVEIRTESAVLLFGDGVALRYHPQEIRPPKHQLLIEFTDGTALSASVQMYGGLWCFREGEFDNGYYKVAKEKPAPLSAPFDPTYFNGLLVAAAETKLSAKAFLATEQRIPGLGNGVLQDILWTARIHPKRKINTFSGREQKALFDSVKTVLADMTRMGGRDTEKDLLGKAGGYKTAMSKNNTGTPCPVCGGFIKKENYLGGSIYYCEVCQMPTV